MQELSRALALCAPAGMGQDERGLWLAAAYAEVAEMQAEVFRQAIGKIRKTADHPAKIIPALWAEAQTWRAVGVNPVIAKPVPQTPALDVVRQTAKALTV